MMQDILDKIKAQRAVKGYSQEFMASKLNLDYSTYGKIENGFSKMTVDRLFKIMEVLDLKADHVFGFSNPKMRNGTSDGPKLYVEIPLSIEDLKK